MQKCFHLIILLGLDMLRFKMIQIFNPFDRFYNASLPSDITLVIDGMNFHLHKVISAAQNTISPVYFWYFLYSRCDTLPVVHLELFIFMVLFSLYLYELVEI